MNNIPERGRKPPLDTQDKIRDAARIRAELEGIDPTTDPFATAARATRMPMIITDARLPDNPVVFANAAFCRLSGYEQAEILGRNCRFLQGPETDPDAIEKIREAVRQARPLEIDILNRRKDGDLFWNRLLIAPVHDADGQLCYFSASQVDVTFERERLVGLTNRNEALIAESADRLHAQQASEARLRFATEAGRLGIWELDVRTRTMTASRIFQEMFGRPGNETFGYDRFQDSIHWDDRVRVRETLEHSILTGADYEVECRTTSPRTGATVWLQLRAQVFRAADGTSLRVAGISLDVTDRKRAEVRRLALVELADRFRDLEEPADVSFAAAEILGRTLAVSRAGYGTIDVPAETITIERDWNAPGIITLAGTLNFRDYGSYIDDLKRGETVICSDAFTDPRTASTASALTAISARSFINMPITEQDGIVALLYLNHETERRWPQDDLDFLWEVAHRTRVAVERRRAEQRLRESEEHFRHAVELNPQVTWTATPDGRLERVSERWQDWTGIAGLDEIWSQGLHADDRDYTQAAWARSVRHGIPLDQEHRLQMVSGDHRWVRSRAFPRRDESGNVVKWYGTTEDIHERKLAEAALQELNETLEQHVLDRTAELEQAQAALRQSQKMEAVGQLTGGIAHDFNNLLTGITGSIELIRSRVAQGRFDAVEGYLHAAEGAAKRAAALTQRLLAFSRRQTLDPKPTDLNRLVAGMEELIRRTVGMSVDMEVVGAGGLWPTLIDPHQLDNALLNLCINARDAMPHGGRLVIETANRWLDDRAAAERDLPPGQYVSLSVTDTGTGMTPEVIARAFDPFFTTKPLGVGTGLGLSMIYGFVRQSGGQVRIYSEVGTGTTMSLYLPRYYGSGAIESEAPAAGSIGPQPGRGDTVLVVDDEPSVRMLITEILTDAGYTAIEAADGSAGLKILESNVPIDLLITDVGLPGGMNGRQVADAGRVLRPGLKVLFVTGYAENAVVGAGHLESGMKVVTKPFSMDAMTSKIREMLAG